MNEVKPNIEIRSDEVQEIMSFIPHWIIRSGIALILFSISFLIIISWFIKYPDTISGEVAISTQTPPAKLVSKSSGELIELMFKEGEKVNLNSNLARIKSDFSINAKQYLEQKCLEAENAQNISLIQFTEDTFFFGSLQSNYSEFKSLIKDYQLHLENNSLSSRLKTLKEQIKNHKLLRSVNYEQINTANKEHENAGHKYTSDKELYAKKVISKIEFFEEEKKYISSENNLNSFKKEVIQNSITIANLEQELTVLTQDEKNKEIEFKNKLGLSISNIRNILNSWDQEYLIKAPFEGRIAYLEELHELQYVNSGTPLFAIIPNGQNYNGKIDIPKAGFGKIRIGQKVRIELDKYPSYEYGSLNGVVTNISLIAKENVYRVSFKLENGLTSTYNREFEYSPEMSGSASIITDDVRLLSRIFNKFRKVLDK